MGNGHTVVVGFSLCKLGLDLHQTRIAGHHKVGGGFIRLWHVLGHLRHAPLRRNEEVAPVFVQATVEQGKQTGFTGTVAADEADMFSGVDGGVDAVEQHFGAAAKNDVFESNHEIGNLGAIIPRAPDQGRAGGLRLVEYGAPSR